MPQTLSPKDILHDSLNSTVNYSSLNSSVLEAMSKAVSQYMPLTDGPPSISFNNYPYPFYGTVRLGSVETGMDLSQSSIPQRPASTSADGGTYSCTYHGCTLRFATPQQLQKHKKEGHRGSGTRRAESVAPGLTSALVDSQAGPHRCDKIKPSTGNPCNRVFSRPYDLTRHEMTVHDPSNRKVLCSLCTEEKSFGRGDALTRHIRIVHPGAEVTGKYRKPRDNNQ